MLTTEITFLNPRADLFKCKGRKIAACATCARKMAPAAAKAQQWIARISKGPACVDYANVATYGPLYSAFTRPAVAPGTGHT